MATPSLEFMALTPVISKMSPSKRKIIPSPELSSPAKRITLLKTGSLTPSQSLKPTNHVILSLYSPLLPEEVKIAKIDGTSASVTGCTHIILDFDLRKDQQLFHNEENRSTLSKVFPGAKIMMFDGFFLALGFDQLPPKPWPRTVAGMPVHLTTKKFDSGPLHKVILNPARTRIYILDEVDARGKTVGNNIEVFDQHVEDIFKYFEKENIKITQIQNWNDFLVIVLKDKGQNIENFPRTILHMPCCILFDEDITPTRQSTLRLEELTYPSIPDDAEYQTLRPGIMVTYSLSSKGDSLTTTSGILVRNSSGKKYVTTAIPQGYFDLGPAHHPKSDGRIIGNISIDHSSGFDIALIELEKNESFVNKTFDSAEGSGRKLASLAATRKMKKGDLVFMDNPFMGRCHGHVGAIIYHPHKGDSEQYGLPVGMWIWIGKDSSQTDSICGSAIWNERDEVIGFFQYFGTGPLDGFCYCTGAENLLRRGYEICQEYDDTSQASY